ncbi:hypothetical protein K466DRAFT_334227 [Polyporus arcularius HHB13444]|uniref:Uncharacterized protein n=1 Tax=Polyporus arcularius HHB13444 TaxID=1314778 RepID=A0A5C3NW39_9APHY|nr:hypothetical protein K466DRAFT_334227 [Polyporus arcularius HHB13444]
MTSIIMTSTSSYNIYARYTFKTPEGWAFSDDKAVVRQEYKRWQAAEHRRNLKAQNTAKTTTRARARSVGAEDVDEAAKRKAFLKVIEDERAAKLKARILENRRRKTKRKATCAVDGDRAVKKAKTNHVAGILKVDGGATGTKQVRWCGSVQEPRETVRPKIVRVSCPDSNPTTRSQNATTTPAPTTMQIWPWPKVPMGLSLTFEDVPEVRPGEAKPRKAMVMRHSDDHQWNRKIVIPPWTYRHAQYHKLRKMHVGLERRIKFRAELGAPMARLLLASCL